MESNSEPVSWGWEIHEEKTTPLITDQVKEIFTYLCYSYLQLDRSL